MTLLVYLSICVVHECCVYPPPNLKDRLSNIQGSLYRGLSLIKFNIIKI